ncbi:IucA/IucC family C-terminal-domain containing protein [Alkalicoccobacillus gibsonii]|uniref:IucA/IucC family C-terminal-domain containing protein n=1 Tax=Alkalicoccobacillus gibsonii TaxID=79881 RepID=UPI0035186612
MNELMREDLIDLGMHPLDNNKLGIPSHHLVNEELCYAFLQSYMKKIQAPNIRITASLFMKQYARITIAAMLYQIGSKNRHVTLPLASCYFGEDRKLMVDVEQVSWNEWTSGTREEWLARSLQSFFTYHLTPVISMLQKTAKVSSPILWENVAVRINSYYRGLLKEGLSNEQLNLVKGDFSFLKQASGELFGLELNPLSSYLHLDTSFLTRRTCCMYYLVGKREYCGVCPLTKTPSKAK